MGSYEEIFGDKKIVIFDIDGTLVDSVVLHTDVLMRAYHTIGKIPEPNPQIFRNHMGKPSQDYIEAVYRDHGIEKPNTERIAGIREYHYHEITQGENSFTPLHVLEGVIPLLERLKREGKHLAIVSGNPRKTGEGILQRTGLSSYFEASGFSDDLFHGEKTRRRSQLLQKVMEEIVGNNPASAQTRILVVGDTLHDIRAAHEQGMDSLALGTGGVSEDELRSEKPTHYRDTLGGIA
ncbi:MAG: HAD family hydrolase [archaeon]